jgi:hypothetical protein
MSAFPIAVIMERRRLSNRWVEEAWEAVGVVPAFAADAQADAAGETGRPPARRIVADAERVQWLHAGFALELFRDEAENYFLNLSAPIPKVFVMWRREGGAALPHAVSVSYGEAARWLDSGEQVDGVAMAREIADWVGDFVNTHYRPAPRTKVRRNDPLGLERRRP